MTKLVVQNWKSSPRCLRGDSGSPFGPSLHQGKGANDASFSEGHVVQQHGVHPHQTILAHCGAMHHCTMPNVGTFFQQNRRAWKHVQHTPFLHIGPTLQHNLAPVSSQHRMRPNIAFLPHGDVSDEGGLRVHKRSGVHHWHHATKGIRHEADALRITTA